MQFSLVTLWTRTWWSSLVLRAHWVQSFQRQMRKRPWIKNVAHIKVPLPWSIVVTKDNFPSSFCLNRPWNRAESDFVNLTQIQVSALRMKLSETRKTVATYKVPGLWIENNNWKCGWTFVTLDSLYSWQCCDRLSVSGGNFRSEIQLGRLAPSQRMSNGDYPELTASNNAWITNGCLQWCTGYVLRLQCDDRHQFPIWLAQVVIHVYCF